MTRDDLVAPHREPPRQTEAEPATVAEAFLNEYLLIRHGLHPDWVGDPVLNAEAFTARWAASHPGDAANVAAAIEATAGDKLPPAAAARVAKGLRSQGPRP